jgi:hypothetical protein
MKHRMLAPLALSTFGAISLGGCPSDPPDPVNPPILWLNLDMGMETEVRLQDREPHPF